VVAADAGGSAFGNPDSRRGYRQLIASAQSKYGAAPTLFVAESMGALPALALLPEFGRREVKGMVGITPMMGIPPYVRSTSYIASAWRGDVSDSADPMSWSPDVFAGRAIRLYEADEDSVIPGGATARDFADRFGAVATVEVVRCDGGHVDGDCYDGADVERWMAGLG
jgi:alpha-beta hydrolase superfamily lysophospholipase